MSQDLNQALDELKLRCPPALMPLVQRVCDGLRAAQQPAASEQRQLSARDAQRITELAERMRQAEYESDDDGVVAARDALGGLLLRLQGAAGATGGAQP